MHSIAGSHDACDQTGRVLVARFLAKSLVQVGVERCSNRLDGVAVMLLEQSGKLRRHRDNVE